MISLLVPEQMCQNIACGNSVMWGQSIRFFLSPTHENSVFRFTYYWIMSCSFHFPEKIILLWDSFSHSFSNTYLVRSQWGRTGWVMGLFHGVTEWRLGTCSSSFSFLAGLLWDFPIENDYTFFKIHFLMALMVFVSVHITILGCSSTQTKAMTPEWEGITQRHALKEHHSQTAAKTKGKYIFRQNNWTLWFLRLGLGLSVFTFIFITQLDKGSEIRLAVLK